MVRRVNPLPSNRLLWTALCIVYAGASLPAQSISPLRVGPITRSPILAAPFLSFPAPPTSVAAGDLNGDGRLDLVITQQSSGNVTVLLGDGKGGFSAGVDYPAAKQAGHVLLADLNGDGRLDVAVTDSAGDVDVLFGNGDGTLGAAVSYAAQAGPAVLALGNFAGKGKIDLVVSGTKGVSVLLNDGTGRLSSAAVISVAVQPVSLTAADLRGAGHDDLVLANQDGTVTAMLGDGAGNFHPQSSLNAAPGPLAAVVAGDFNGDGHPDLALAAAGSNAVAILLGHGDGSFSAPVSYAVGNNPAALIAADLRGNGVTDLVSVNQAANTFSVLLGNGDGSFHPSNDFVAGNTPIALAAGDFNGDGHADLAIVNNVGATVTVPLGRGDGAFVASRVYRADLERKAIASGDLNGDGRPDLVVTNFCGSDASCASNGTATVFLGQLGGAYQAASTIALGNGPIAVALADLNGDKKLDLLALNQIDKSLLVRQGNGDGTFGAAQTYALSASPRALYVGDFNGDGHPDLAIVSDCGQTTCSQPGTLDIWLGRGDGSLAASASYTVGYAPVSIAAGDLRGTGHLDLVVANSCGDASACAGDGTGTLLANDGAGKFTSMGEVDLGLAPSSIAIGNLSGTGLDLAVAQRGSNQIAVMHVNGSGGFSAPVTYAVGTAPSALAIADLNGDGNQDVAVTNFQSSTVSILYGTGSGALSAATTYPVSAGPDSLVAIAPAGKGGIPTLVTANGDSGATPMGNGITALGGTGGTTASTTTITSSANTSAVVDTQVTITGNVAGSGATPTGNLVFAIDTGGGTFAYLSDCGGAAGVLLDGSGNATCRTQLLPAGTDNIQLQYFGDSTYATSASADQAQTISAAGTTTTVSPTTASTFGQSVTFIATVAPTSTITVTSNDALAFSGNVKFLAGGSAISGCGSLSVTNNAASENATATCITSSPLPVGANSITAQYNSGDPNYNTSTSGAVTQTVNQASPTTTIAAFAGGIQTPFASLNATVTFTATLNLPSGVTTAPSGATYSFTNNGAAISGCATQALSPSAPYQATCSIASLNAGSHAIVATYSTGDTNYASTSGSISETVVASRSAVSISSSLSSGSIVNQSVTFTVQVTPNGITLPNAGVVQLSGTVTLTDGVGGPPVPGCAVSFTNTTGVATCSTSSLSNGSHTIVATYSGDSNYPPGGTAQLTQVVSAGASTTSLGASPSSSTVGQPVTFTATIGLPVGSTIAPTGVVNFTNNSTTIPGCGTAGVVFNSSAGAYQATCTTSSLAATTGPNPNTIRAIYTSGDTNYGSSQTAAPLAYSVTAAGTTTTLASSPNPSSVGQQVVFTATIGGLPTGATIAPTGTVNFTNNGTTLTSCGSVTISSTAPYTATCPTASLTTTTGSNPNTISAIYTSGDSNYNGSQTAGPLTQTVNPGATSVTVAASPSSPTLNQSVTFKATVTLPSGATSTPTGTINFTDNGTAIAGCSGLSLSSSSPYIAQCSIASLSGAGHTIVATYSGDSNYLSSFGNLNISLTASPTTTTISAAPNPSTINQAVVFTVAVTGSGPTVTPTGPVTVVVDGTNSLGECTIAWNASASASTCTISTSTLSTGTHSVSASYSGDSNYNSSTGTLSPQLTVGGAATSLVLVSSLPVSAVNASVTFTATLTYPSGGLPLTGSVAFTDSVTSAAIPNCSAQALAISGSAGTAAATCTTSTLAFGSHNITATYTDSTNNFVSSTSAPVTQSVGTAPISMALSSSASTGVVNQAAPISFSAVITAPSGTTSLTGTVAFTDNGAAITTCSAVPPSADGTSGASSLWLATCSDSALTATTHTIAASYTGDRNFGVANATLATPVTLSAAATTIAVTASPNPSSFNQPVVLSATVSAPAGGVALAGKVTFADNGTTITSCTPTTPPANGVVTCTYPGLAIGTHTITAAYGADANFSSTSNTTSQTVGSATTGVSVVSSANPSVVNQSVNFTATVSSSAQGGTAFTGMMSFVAGASAITGCTNLPVSGGVAHCTTSSLPVGTTIITANYANDPSFGGASGTVAQTVNSSSAYALALSASPSTALVESGQPVIFTAQITPAYSGSLALNGSMVFTDTYTSPSGATSSVTLCAWPAGSANFTAAGVATCTYTLPDGSNSVVASYTGDTKFTAVSGTANQTVDDFSVSIAPVPQNSVGVQITQGFKGTTDPYPAQPLIATPNSIAGFTGTVTLTCAPTPASASAPTCTLGSNSLAVVTTGTQQSTGIALDATNAAPGTYTYALTATDANGLTHVSTFPVSVRALSAPLSVVSGATTNNTTTLTFVLPAGVSLPLVNSTTSNTGSCATVVGPEIASNLTPLNLSIGCGFNPAIIPSSSSQQTGTVTVTISTGGTIAMAQPASRSGLMIAGLIGLPIFGLLGFLGGRKSGSTLFLRLLAILALCAAGWQVMGCGGAFQGSNSTGGGQTPPGVYNILVQATGSDNNTYQAVIQLNVKL